MPWKNYRVRDWAADQRGLTALEFRVLFCLADYADADGTNAYPATSSLAEAAECSESSVKRALGDLEARGVITRGKQLSSRHTVVYRLGESANLTLLKQPEVSNGPLRSVRMTDNLHTLPSQIERDTHNTRAKEARDEGGLSRSDKQPRKQASPIAQDWCPGSGAMDVAERHLGDAWSDQVELFIAHAQDTDRLSADWDAAFRFWCIKASRYQRLDRERSARATPSGRPGNKKNQEMLAPITERVEAYVAGLPEGHEAHTESIEDFHQMSRVLGLEDYRGDIAKPLECFTAFIQAEYPTQYLWEAVKLWFCENPGPPKSSAAFRAIWTRYCPRSGFGGEPEGGQMWKLRERMKELKGRLQ